MNRKQILVDFVHELKTDSPILIFGSSSMFLAGADTKGKFNDIDLAVTKNGFNELFTLISQNKSLGIKDIKIENNIQKNGFGLSNRLSFEIKGVSVECFHEIDENKGIFRKYLNDLDKYCENSANNFFILKPPYLFESYKYLLKFISNEDYDIIKNKSLDLYSEKVSKRIERIGVLNDFSKGFALK